MTYEMKILEAHNDGKEEGLKEGQLNKAKDMAIKMLRRNEPMDKIIEYTDLSEKEIEALSNQQ